MSGVVHSEIPLNRTKCLAAMSDLEFVVQDGALSTHEDALRELLDGCFPGWFEGRTFYKQEPHKRVLAFSGSRLVGQVGLDFRVINVAGQIVKIVGVIDVCVAEPFRNNGIGRKLLFQAEAVSGGRDFALLMADCQALYVRCGYKALSNAPTRWLAIEDLQSHSVIERDLGDCFMYKPLQGAAWPGGAIDLLGYLF